MADGYDELRKGWIDKYFRLKGVPEEEIVQVKGISSHQYSSHIAVWVNVIRLPIKKADIIDFVDFHRNYEQIPDSETAKLRAQPNPSQLEVSTLTQP